MKVIFGFDNQFIGKYEIEKYLPNDTTREQIIKLFPTILGINFNEDCYYRIRGGINMIYPISEEELRDLLYCRHTLAALECGGVDNWPWYGDSISDYEKMYCDDNGIEDNLCISEIVEKEISKYESIKNNGLYVVTEE